MKDLKITKNILNENSEILKLLFKDISKYPVISSEEQIELARKAKNGDLKAQDKLVNCNLRFIVTCAKKYVNQGVPLLDLIDCGVYGLIQSLEKFNPDKGYKFLSFAVWYIRREILKEIYNTSRTIRYPITYISKLTKSKKVIEDFVSEHGREPSPEEIIELTNFTKEQYKATVVNKSFIQSINTPILSDDKATIEDVIPDNGPSIIDNFDKITILDTLKILTPREKEVIILFYGLNGVEKPIKEISKELNLGEERIRQLRKTAIKKLRQRCGKTLSSLL